MKTRPRLSSRHAPRHHYLFTLVQATLGEPRLVGRTSGTPLRPIPPSYLKPGRLPPTTAHAIPYQGRRRPRNRRTRVTPGTSLKDLSLLGRRAGKTTEQEDIALQLDKSIAAAHLLEEVTHTPSPEWKVVDDIAVEFLESQKPEWKGDDVDAIKKNPPATKIPAINKQIQKLSPPILPTSLSNPFQNVFPTSIPYFIPSTIPSAIPTTTFQSAIPTSYNSSLLTSIPTPIPTAIPVAMPTSSTEKTPKSTKSSAGKKGALASKPNTKSPPNSKPAAGKKGSSTDSKADSKGPVKKGAKSIVGAKNADKPDKPDKSAAQKSAAKSAANKPSSPAPKGKKPTANPALSPKVKPVTPPKEQRKVGFKVDPPASNNRGKGNTIPKNSRSTVLGGGGGPKPKMSKSTPGGKDINIEKYTQQIVKLKKALQENTNVVTTLEKQLMLDGKGRPQTEANVMVREQMVRLDMELQSAKARIKELEDLYVSEKLAREEDCRTIKSIEAARDDLQKLVDELQQQGKAMKDTYEAKVSMLTTTVTGLHITQQEQNRIRNNFSFAPNNVNTMPNVSYSTIQIPKPLVIPATFASAQSPPSATYARSTSPRVQAPNPFSVISSSAEQNSPVILEVKLKETQDSLNKEWKDRIELEEKYSLEKKTRLELEGKYNLEKDKFMMEHLKNTKLDARLALAESELAAAQRELDRLRKSEIPLSLPRPQWPPQTNSPLLTPTGSSIRDRLRIFEKPTVCDAGLASS